jgi:hypothetical protein
MGHLAFFPIVSDALYHHGVPAAAVSGAALGLQSAAQALPAADLAIDATGVVNGVSNWLAPAGYAKAAAKAVGAKHMSACISVLPTKAQRRLRTH